MSPFRDTPEVELGPLTVGLGEAAVRAITRLPRGGRLVADGAGVLALHQAGAIGSLGVVGFVAALLGVWGSGWRPSTGVEVVACAAGIVLGGLSLALVLRAADRHAAQAARPAEIIGRRARRVLVRMARLVEAWADKPSARRLVELRLVLSEAADPELARWIPADVRGRAELFLARATATLAGPRWPSDRVLCDEIRGLLRRSADHLADPSPASADLAALDLHPIRRADRLRIAAPDPVIDDLDELDEPAVRHLER